MNKNRSPYIGYTLEDVKSMENYFVLCFGGDFVLENDYYLFTKEEVSKIYKKMLKDLKGIAADGSEKDKKYALDLIGGLKILPMRLH
jgi:hypothetical protein